MEIGYVLRDLWRLKLWIALGVVVAVGAAAAVVYEVPSFKKKEYELGAATTDVVVEARRQPLGEVSAINPSTGPNLVSRTALYARLISSPPVRELIAQESGIPVQRIVTAAPQPAVTSGREIASEERGNQLLVENNLYRVLTASNPELPILTISTLAPTAREAIKLADAAVSGLARFVHKTADDQDVPDARRLRFRQLGPAVGGAVAENADYQLAAMAFAGAWAGWCVLVLVLSRVAASWRAARAAERRGARQGAEPDNDDDVDDPDDDVYADRERIRDGISV